ncbi:MAG: 50S ribosomal protein L5 [Patescibacteria group bacterium]
MLFEDYQKILLKLKDELKVANFWAVPRVSKVVVNMRVADGKDDASAITDAKEELRLIVGQQPRVCPARRSISGFKLRQGSPIGLKATLRGKRMMDFLERLFNLVLPRLRDFRGLPLKGFDQAGNFNIGFRDQSVFPEVDLDKIKKTLGLQVTIVTSTKSQPEAVALLKSLGLPFAKQE